MGRARKHKCDRRAHLHSGSVLCIHAVGKVHGFLLPAEALERMRMPELPCICHNTAPCKLMGSLELTASFPLIISGAQDLHCS